MSTQVDSSQPGDDKGSRAIRAPSLTELAYQEIEGMILARELETGERLNDSQLAKRFGISRGPVREAIGRLASAGLVEMVQNRGAYVRVIDVKAALEIYDIRPSLERAAVLAAIRHLDAERLAELRRQVERMDVFEASEDREGYFAANLEFHRMIYKASGNERLLELSERLARELRLFRHVSLITAGIHESNREHHQILEALERGEAQRAATAMEQHVNRAKERLMTLAEKLKNKSHELNSASAG
jgi:DNA-binding GntR family transcriptional regulator